MTLAAALDALPRSARAVLDRCLDGRPPSWRALLPLCDATGATLHALCLVADTLRARQVGPVVTYVVNRNINFTNVCVKTCHFCAFSRGVRSEQGYFLGPGEVARRAVEARDLGATEVCLQAGLAPTITADTYLELCRAIKRAAPELHIHGLSPEEVKLGARRAGAGIRDFLTALVDAGLGSLPGTSAEILDDDIRRRISPGRISTREWIEVVTTAHDVGLPTTCTMMFGHVEGPGHRLRHMELLRSLQRETGGFTEFVPLSFVHHHAPLFADQPGVSPGPSGLDVVRTYALARLMLGGDIANLQVSWVKEGLRSAEHLLTCGANDLGGTLMNESISTTAGAGHGQLATPAELEGAAAAAGRPAAERTTLYRAVERHHAAGGALDRLDGVRDADRVFGSYAELAADARHRFRRRPADQGAELRRVVEVEGKPGPAQDARAEPGGRAQVAAKAIAAEAGGGHVGQAQAEAVGPPLYQIRRHHRRRSL